LTGVGILEADDEAEVVLLRPLRGLVGTEEEVVEGGLEELGLSLDLAVEEEEGAVVRVEEEEGWGLGFAEDGGRSGRGLVLDLEVVEDAEGLREWVLEAEEGSLDGGGGAGGSDIWGKGRERVERRKISETATLTSSSSLTIHSDQKKT